MRGESASSTNYSKTSENAGKRIKMYVDSPMGKYPDILQKNVRFWETLEISTLRLDLIRTTGTTPYPGKL